MNNYFKFRVDTLGLLNEIADAGLDRKMGVLKIPLNIFKNLLADVAERAIELNDDKLNVLMLSLGLYEGTPSEIVEKIDILTKRIELNEQNQP